MKQKYLPLPTQERLLQLLSYDPYTGVLRWKKRNGNIAGCIPKGKLYRIVVVDGQGYYAQRLIWRMMTGQEPASVVDHADHDEANNRWTNLRAADRPENGYNRKLNENNKSGVKGVCWEQSHSAWKAVITVDKKVIRLGRFKRLSDAAAAISAARIRYHGEFARAA